MGQPGRAARLRLIGALKETVLFGTPNNKDFLIQCLEKQSFIDGAATTAFIAEEFSEADLAVAAGELFLTVRWQQRLSFG